MTPVLELAGIRKAFGGVVALDDVTFRVQPGTIHALLGENGAGKSTLMRVVYGLVQPEAGTIRVNGSAVTVHSPRDAMRRGIGMVHQHFTLVPALSVMENVALGLSGPYQPRRVREQLLHLSATIGLDVNSNTCVRDLSVVVQQRVEILKALARDVRLLILDEPTAVLAPSEAEDLLSWLRAFARTGKSVVLITHKLREARVAADMFTVLRQGRVALSGDASALDDQALVAAMVGDPVARPTPAEDVPPLRASDRRSVLELSGVSLVRDGRIVLDDVSLSVGAREILGVAAAEGAGHRDLLRLLAGRAEAFRGVVTIPADVAFIPDDRHLEGVVLDMSVLENVALRDLGQRRGLVPWETLGDETDELMRAFDIRAASSRSLVSMLSGGNQQKLVIAREFSPLPHAVVADNPTRGLDIRATADVQSHLRRARDAGCAVVLYSADLDELLSLADRVVAVYSGRVREVPRDRAVVGRAMLGFAA